MLKFKNPHWKTYNEFNSNKNKHTIEIQHSGRGWNLTYSQDMIMSWILSKYTIYWNIIGNLIYSRLSSIDEMLAQWLAFGVFKMLTRQTSIFLPGTLLVIYNLKLLLSGEPELDVKTDKEDILMTGALEEWVMCIFCNVC